MAKKVRIAIHQNELRDQDKFHKLPVKTADASVKKLSKAVELG